MYFYLDIPFNTVEEAKNTLGDIKMFYVGNKELGYQSQNEKKYRKYVLNSKDISKLNNINNAIDGSEAYVVDTQKTYYLLNGQWL